ncbi:MAG: serine/threonine protein kinase [Candidatus Kapaibacterium sp.]
MAKQYGSWKTEKSLSEGGQGVVYLVTHQDEPNNFRVLKRLKNTNRILRFQDEIRAISELQHPNIVTLIDYDIESTPPYLVTEYCSGGTLSKLNLSTLDTTQRLRLFLNICRGVGHAHEKGIIHRDLKPENIFLQDDQITPVVGDFGICHIDNGNRVTLIDEVVGARHFTAPELEESGSSEVSASADVYSLGKILYWIFANKTLSREGHRGNDSNIASLWKDIPLWKSAQLGWINQLLDDSIQLDPNDRFNDAEAFAQATERVLQLIEARAHTLDMRDVQLCTFCGRGQYQIIGSSSSTDSNVRDPQHWGVRTISGQNWLILCCRNCGHTQQFRLDLAQNSPSNWRNLKG